MYSVYFWRLLHDCKVVFYICAPQRVRRTCFEHMPYAKSVIPAGNGRGQQHSQALFRLSRFSPEYRSRLIRGLTDVQDFCQKDFGVQLSQVLRQPKLADKVFGRYVIKRHGEASKSGLSLVKHALLGVQHVMPGLRRRLVTAWENMRAWEEQKSSRLRAPLPVPIWAFMVGLARAHARVCDPQEARQWNIFAILLEVGLLCLLRPGELLRLKGVDFALPGVFSLSQSQAAIRVVAPKNRRQFGAEQFVTLSNQNTIAWIRQMGLTAVTSCVWEAPPSRFAKLFKQLALELGVEKCKFTPASLRPGGATMFYGRGMSIPVLRFLGRWTVERSLEHYIQQAMAVQIVNRMEEDTTKRLQRLGAFCLDMILHDSCLNTVPRLPSSQRKSGSALVKWCNTYAELAC